MTLSILHTETLMTWGGQQNRVFSESAGLSKRGHKIIIACNRGSVLAQKAQDEGIKVYELNMSKHAHLITIPRLINIIKKEAIDIVSTHSSVDSWAGGIAAKLTNRKLVRFKHNINTVGRDPLTRYIYLIPDKFISVSGTSVNALKQAGFIRHEKIERVYGGIDFDKFDPDKISETERKRLKKSLNIPENALIIGNTPGFTRVKGQHYLLSSAEELFRQSDNIFLLLVGGSGISQKEKVLQYVKPEFHNRVILPGYRTDIPLLLSIMDIFVFPSTKEAFGLALSEAMAMAKPVLVSDIPSFREYIIDNENGLFFKSADSGSLLNKLSYLIENPEKRSVLGNNAKKTVRDKFPFERMIDETEKIYLDLAGK